MQRQEDQTAEKLRGGYYTPIDIAEFIVRWACADRPRSLLEPSCGDGVFFQALRTAESTSETSVLGFEIIEQEAVKAREAVRESHLSSSRVLTKDFLRWAIDEIVIGDTQFDAVVGNPPFIRYQFLPESAQSNAESIFRLLKVPFTRHTNAWVPFVLASLALLRPGGRLGMVVPSEIIHVVHARGLRNALGKWCRRITLLDPEEIWFENTLQGAVILFAEKKRNVSQHCDGVSVIPVRGREFLRRKSAKALISTGVPANGPSIEGKWTHALLSVKERALLESIEQRESVYRFDTLADVDVGIVTGANSYFLVPDETIEKYDLGQWAHPMFGRSEHCPGVIYDADQHNQNRRLGHPTNFLWFDEGPGSLGTGARKYIKLGESNQYHTRYKCSVRSPWYEVPSVYATDVGMLKRAHDAPRLILNKLKALTTDTAYRIRLKQIRPSKFVYSFLNPLTALSAELEGRHYGGGVLELVPSEIERLLIPVPRTPLPRLEELDVELKSIGVTQVMLHQCPRVLGPVGITKSEQTVVMDAWLRLKNRRQRVSVSGD